MESVIRDKTILITGGTGSFGQKFTEIALRYNPKSIRIYSRSELPQVEMQRRFSDDCLRFFVGDVRDRERLMRAMTGVDLVIHAAALKHVPICEYNPIEAVQTNIGGTANLVNCAIESGVKKVIAVSTDKAVQPVNLYGATKLVMEKLVTQANVYARQQTAFSCTRYGNVIDSRGSVLHLFREQAITGKITITSMAMTRFWLTLEQGVQFVINSIGMMKGGEIFIPKIPSVAIYVLAVAAAPNCIREIVGIRPGEKLHEILLTPEEARHAKEFEDHYRIHPEFPFWTEDTYWDETGDALPEDFSYTSNNNNWLSVEEIEEVISDVH